MRLDPDRLTCDLTTEVCACDLHAGHTGQHRCVCGIRWGEQHEDAENPRAAVVAP